MPARAITRHVKLGPQLSYLSASPWMTSASHQGPQHKAQAPVRMTQFLLSFLSALCCWGSKGPWIQSSTVIMPYRLRTIFWDWIQQLNTEDAMAERKPNTATSSSGCLLQRESCCLPHHGKAPPSISLQQITLPLDLHPLQGCPSLTQEQRLPTRTSDFLCNPQRHQISQPLTQIVPLSVGAYVPDEWWLFT